MSKILVSACLLGIECRYKGDACPCQKVIDLSKPVLVGPAELYARGRRVQGGVGSPDIPVGLGDADVRIVGNAAGIHPFIHRKVGVG